MGTLLTDWLRNKKCLEWICPCSTSIGTLRKERTSWHKLLRETSLGCTTFNQNQKDLPWNENIPPRQQKKVQDDSIIPQVYAHRVLGHARGHTAEIPGSRWECECHVILHHSAGTLTVYLPQTTWTPDKGSDSSGWQCPPSQSKSNSGAVMNI